MTCEGMHSTGASPVQWTCLHPSVARAPALNFRGGDTAVDCSVALWLQASPHLLKAVQLLNAQWPSVCEQANLVKMCAQAAAAVLQAFPPRGIIRLLPPEHTGHGAPKVERLVAEEYVLDTIHFFEGDRVQCARRLAAGARPMVPVRALQPDRLPARLLCFPLHLGSSA